VCTCRLFGFLPPLATIFAPTQTLASASPQSRQTKPPHVPSLTHTLPVQALAYNSSHEDHSQLRQTLTRSDDSFATTPARNTSILAHSLATCLRPVHSQPRLRIPGFLCTSRTSCTSHPLNQGESPAARHGSSKDPQRYPLFPCPQPRCLSTTTKLITSRNILSP
jgi:hypothetical protein